MARLSAEILVPRLGDSLVKEGLITSDQLKQALEHQKMENEAGQNALLGQVLIQMGFISRENLDQAITNQVFMLHNALIAANQNLEARVKARTQELEDAYRKLKEIDQLKSNFISNVSHELRTPLTHILGYLDLFETDQDITIPEVLREGMDVMHRSAERLHRLIDDLIQFSTSEDGRMIILRDLFDISAAAREVLSSQKENAMQRGVALRLVKLEHNMNVHADPKLIHWVLNQLVENGIKYTEKGGCVSVVIKKKQEMALVQVVDTGIGISQERVRELFLPFHQLDGSTNRKQGGTGIGLAMAKRIINAHHSDLKVISSSSGSTFEFELPLEA